ncbi:MFS transporter [Propionibacterium cyclohexanicum]|uniref:MFS transporter n=1 Tax=Propionibacterium cyclohexanicum TaxID=64702 RepID=UPI000B88F1E7
MDAAAPASALGAAGPATRKKITAWALWDWGTQPWASVVTTFVFSVYLVSSHFGTANHTALVQSVCLTSASVIIALTAPLSGQGADRSGHTMRTLRWLTWGLAIITASLVVVAPSPAWLWPGFLLVAAGTILSEIASASYNAAIDQVATPGNVGRISGFGWGMGYLGGIVALLAIYFAFIAPEVGLFGVSGTNSMDIRVSMLFCAVWIVVFTAPIFRTLRDQPPREPVPRLGIVGSYRRLFASIAGLWRTHRTIVWFLLASALFRDGLNGIFIYGGAMAQNTFGFSASQVLIFGAAANIVAGVATILMGRLDDRIGPKPVIVISLVALIVLAMAVFFLHDRGQAMFWVLGLILCLFVGPAQAASRSYLARLIPAGMSGEVFGLYATTGRVASPLSPALFGLFVTIGMAVTGTSNAQYFGIIGIAIVLLAGLIALIPVGRHEAGRPAAG